MMGVGSPPRIGDLMTGNHMKQSVEFTYSWRCTYANYAVALDIQCREQIILLINSGYSLPANVQE